MLEDEINRYHQDSNRQAIATLANLETEIGFLRRKIESTQSDIDGGRAKAFYSELLIEMRTELDDKELMFQKFNHKYEPLVIDEVNMTLIKSDLRRLIELLDADTPNVESLNAMIAKYISSISIHRETKTVHVVISIKLDGAELYRNTIATDWDVASQK
jgi:hypothetical protein